MQSHTLGTADAGDYNGSLMLKHRLSRAVLDFNTKLATWTNGALVQVWMPEMHSDGSMYLGAQGLPFAVAGVGDLLALFRCVSCRYRFSTDVMKPSLMGAIGRVYASCEPEMSHNVQKYDKKVYLRVSEAQRCRVRSTVVLPVFTSASRDRPVAVFELAQADKDLEFPSVLSWLKNALSGVDLFTTDMDIAASAVGLRKWPMEVDVSFLDLVGQQTGDRRLGMTVAAKRTASSESYGSVLDPIASSKKDRAAIVQEASSENEVFESETGQPGCATKPHINNATRTPGGEANGLQGIMPVAVNPAIVPASTIQPAAPAVSCAPASITNLPVLQLNNAQATLSALMSSAPAALQALQAQLAIVQQRNQQGNQILSLSNLLATSVQNLLNARAMQALQNNNGTALKALAAACTEEPQAMASTDAPQTTPQPPAQLPPAQLPPAPELVQPAVAQASTTQPGRASKAAADEDDELISSSGSDDDEDDGKTRRSRGDGEGRSSRSQRSLGAGRRLRYEDLQSQFGLSLKEAAANLGICATTLKRACRRNGITRWPRRQIQKLNRVLTQLGYQGMPAGGGQLVPAGGAGGPSTPPMSAPSTGGLLPAGSMGAGSPPFEHAGSISNLQQQHSNSGSAGLPPRGPLPQQHDMTGVADSTPIDMGMMGMGMHAMVGPQYIDGTGSMSMQAGAMPSMYATGSFMEALCSPSIQGEEQQQQPPGMPSPPLHMPSNSQIHTGNGVVVVDGRQSSVHSLASHSSHSLSHPCSRSHSLLSDGSDHGAAGGMVGNMMMGQQMSLGLGAVHSSPAHDAGRLQGPTMHGAEAVSHASSPVLEIALTRSPHSVASPGQNLYTVSTPHRTFCEVEEAQVLMDTPVAEDPMQSLSFNGLGQGYLELDAFVDDSFGTLPAMHMSNMDGVEFEGMFDFPKGLF